MAYFAVELAAFSGFEIGLIQEVLELAFADILEFVLPPHPHRFYRQTDKHNAQSHNRNPHNDLLEGAHVQFLLPKTTHL